MGTIRIVLTSWRDLASAGPSIGGEAGDMLAGTVQIQPTLTEGWVLDADGNLHFTDAKSYTVNTLPWSVVLVDPTGCLRPSSGWGYRIWLCPQRGPRVLVELGPEVIGAVVPDEAGVRTIDLADHARLAGPVQ